MYFYYSNDSLIKYCIRSFFKDCYCLVYIFDLTNIDTLNKLEEMIKFLYNEENACKIFLKNFPLLIIGNKSDIKKEINVSKSEMEKLCSPIKLVDYIEVSAKNSIGLKEAFERIEKNCLDYYNYYQYEHQEMYLNGI